MAVRFRSVKELEYKHTCVATVKEIIEDCDAHGYAASVPTTIYIRNLLSALIKHLEAANV